MTLPEFLLLSSIVFIAMASPGPDFILVSRNSLLYPRRIAMGTAFGIVTGCSVAAVLSVLGLAAILAHSILLFSVVKYAGAVYLVYLGVKGLLTREVESAPLNGTQKTARKDITLVNAYLQGVFCNLLNPKLAIFLLSLFTQFIDVEATLTQKTIVASVFFVESLIYWPVLVMLIQIPSIKNFFLDFRLWLDRIFGALLLGLGLKVALSSRE